MSSSYAGQCLKDPGKISIGNNVNLTIWVWALHQVVAKFKSEFIKVCRSDVFSEERTQFDDDCWGCWVSGWSVFGFVNHLHNTWLRSIVQILHIGRQALCKIKDFQGFLVNFPVWTYVIGLNERKLPLFTEFKTLALLPRYCVLNVAKIPYSHS